MSHNFITPPLTDEEKARLEKEFPNIEKAVLSFVEAVKSGMPVKETLTGASLADFVNKLKQAAKEQGMQGEDLPSKTAEYREPSFHKTTLVESLVEVEVNQVLDGLLVDINSLQKGANLAFEIIGIINPEHGELLRSHTGIMFEQINNLIKEKKTKEKMNTTGDMASPSPFNPHSNVPCGHSEDGPQ